MADHRKLFKPEVLHHFNLILRHRALGVAAMIDPVGRLAAIAISPQIRSYHGEFGS